ncbi:hypothetical protein QJS66_06995 [Kocuria rhizophila]|nr:hypothetical protein QJS66_06995 [Kocuria rhizophila]
MGINSHAARDVKGYQADHRPPGRHGRGPEGSGNDLRRRGPCAGARDSCRRSGCRRQDQGPRTRPARRLRLRNLRALHRGPADGPVAGMVELAGYLGDQALDARRTLGRSRWSQLNPRRS